MSLFKVVAGAQVFSGAFGPLPPDLGRFADAGAAGDGGYDGCSSLPCLLGGSMQLGYWLFGPRSLESGIHMPSSRGDGSNGLTETTFWRGVVALRPLHPAAGCRHRTRRGGEKQGQSGHCQSDADPVACEWFVLSGLFGRLGTRCRQDCCCSMFACSALELLCFSCAGEDVSSRALPLGPTSLSQDYFVISKDFLPGQQQRKTGYLGCDRVLPHSFAHQNRVARALCKGSCDEIPREFLVASACADLSEHLPLLHEVSMSLECFSALYVAQKIEVTPSGAWMVAQELSAENASGRGPLAGPGAEAVGTRPASVRLPIGSLLVSASSADGSVCLNEIEMQNAAAFQPMLLFEILRAANGLFIWRVPLPMHLFWNEEFQSKLEVRGVHLRREKVLDLLRHPQAEMFGRHQSATEMP
ncbi:unnamed protein product [Symbiodinium sp. KB8]|nr:unnamed protein product [Symbiodinium sp. KB8]